MKTGNVFRNGMLIGTISKSDAGKYRFVYSPAYLRSDGALPFSVNFPLRAEPFVSDELFPFFFNMLSEGNLKDLQCRSLQIDEEDHFARLLRTTSSNTIGSITVVGRPEASKLREQGLTGLSAILAEMDDVTLRSTK